MNHGIGKLWTRQKKTDMVLPSWQETFVTEVFSWANFIMKIQYEPLVKLPDTMKNLCSIQYFIQLLFTLFIFLTHLYAVPLTQTFIDQKWLESKPEPWAKQLTIPAQCVYEFAVSFRLGCAFISSYKVRQYGTLAPLKINCNVHF